LKPWEVKSDLGSGTTIDPHVAKKAAKAVAQHSHGVDDALLLLDMLGLIDPLPGNEPKDLSKTQRANSLETRRERVKKRKEDELKRLNATAEEIGEVEDA
jgi:hypothetical protein